MRERIRKALLVLSIITTAMLLLMLAGLVIRLTAQQTAISFGNSMFILLVILLAALSGLLWVFYAKYSKGILPVLFQSINLAVTVLCAVYLVVTLFYLASIAGAPSFAQV